MILKFFGFFIFATGFLKLSTHYHSQIYIYIDIYTLHKKEVFGQLNPLEKCFKICYVYGKRKPKQFFSFFIWSNFHFSLMNALVYVDIDQGIHKGKIKVALNEKRKKLHGFSFSINIANFEAFLQRIKLIKNLLFLQSAYVYFFSTTQAIYVIILQPPSPHGGDIICGCPLVIKFFVLCPILTKLSEIAVLMSTVISPSFIKIGLKTKKFYHYAKFCRDPFLNCNYSSLRACSKYVPIVSLKPPYYNEVRTHDVSGRLLCQF